MFKVHSLKCVVHFCKKKGAISFSPSTNIAVYLRWCSLETNIQLMDALFDLGLLLLLVFSLVTRRPEKGE